MILKRYLLCFFFFIHGINAFALHESHAERELARVLATSQIKWLKQLNQKQLALSKLCAQYSQNNFPEFYQSLKAAEQAVHQSLGLKKNAQCQDWYQLRYIARAKKSQASDVLVTYFHDQKKDSIEAFDESGQVVWLDKQQQPAYNVVILEPNDKFYHRAQQLLTRTQQKSAFFSGKHAPKSTSTFSDSSISSFDEETTDVTVLDSIKINEFDEPWWLGNNRVFAVVTGINFADQEPYSEVVEMPYMHKKGKLYQPKHFFIFWHKVKFGVANVTFFQHSSLKDFRELSQIIDSVFSQVKNWPNEIELAFKVVRIGLQITKLLPNSWFEGKSRFLDAFYGIEAGQNYSDYLGAAENVQVSFKNKKVKVKYGEQKED